MIELFFLWWFVSTTAYENSSWDSCFLTTRTSYKIYDLGINDLISTDAVTQAHFIAAACLFALMYILRFQEQQGYDSADNCISRFFKQISYNLYILQKTLLNSTQCRTGEPTRNELQVSLVLMLLLCSAESFIIVREVKQQEISRVFKTDFFILSMNNRNMPMLYPCNIKVKQDISETQDILTNSLIYSHKGGCKCPAKFGHMHRINTAYFSEHKLRYLILAIRFDSFSLKMLPPSLLLHRVKKAVF